MERKSLGKNSIYSICYKLMGVLFPLVLSSYSSYILLSSGVGRVTLVQNITTYFVTIASLGIPYYGTKKIGSVQNDLSERNKVFTELFIINFVSTLICTIAFFAMILIVPYFKDNNLYFVFSSLIVLNIANVDWLYEGLEEYRYIAIRSIAVKLLCLCALPLFVRNREDLFQYSVILCVATVGNYIFNIFHLRKFVSFCFQNLNFKRHLKFVFMLLASVCATEIYTMLDSTMVGTICSETKLGYYSNAIKTTRMTYVLVTAACAVYLPRLSLYWKEKKQEDFNNLANQGMKLVLVLSIPVFAGMELLADRIIPLLFGEDFIPSILTLRLLAVLVIVFSVAYIGGHIILISTNREKYTMYAAFAGALSNFILNIILIQAVGYNGAAIASVIAEIIVTIVLFVSARRFVKYNINARFFISTFISCLGMIILVFVLKSLIQNNLISCIVCPLAGSLLYFALQLLLKNDMVVFIKSNMSGSLKAKSSKHN